ncbi:MAG: DUF2291 family protein [Actinophytocola sp.]|nr:DUF2291 family protein [Actinophytocola sp.]
MSTPTVNRSPQRLLRLLWPVGLGLLLVAMALDTKFLSPDELSASSPAAFDAATSAADEFPKIAGEIEANAVELSEVAADPAAAGEKYGHEAGTDKHAIPVRFTGEVTEADAEFVTLEVPGVPEGSVVRVALGQAVNGTALRAAPGTIAFSDFQNQTDYQQFANELKKVALEQVTGKVDAKSMTGSEVSAVGVYVTNTGPEDSFLITPVKIEAVS